MRLLISLFLLFQTVFADEIVKPHRKFQTSGIVLDFRFFKNKIYAGTDAGTVDIFDLKTGKMEKQIKMKPLPDFYSGTIPAKVYSVSLFQDLMLILSEAKYGGRELSLYQNGKLKHILTTRSPIKKVKLINDVICIYATLGNELVLYDLYNNREIYHVQINSSTFSDFAIQGDLIAMASESGEISKGGEKSMNLNSAFLLRKKASISDFTFFKFFLDSFNYLFCYRSCSYISFIIQ